jgi:hypothetical protein
VRERIEYHFRVSSATVFTLYSYCKTLEYRLQNATAASLRVPTAGSLRRGQWKAVHAREGEEGERLHAAADPTIFII